MKIRLVSFLAASLSLVSVGVVTLQPLAANAQAADDSMLSRESVLRDPDTPVMGNPRGDITIVEYFDYRCPYCKKVNTRAAESRPRRWANSPRLQGLADLWRRLDLRREARARHQISEQVRRSPRGADCHQGNANRAECPSHSGSGRHRRGPCHARPCHRIKTPIDALLARNHAQAVAFGFQGTPAFIIGHFRIPGALDAATFKQAIADARAAQQRK